MALVTVVCVFGPTCTLELLLRRHVDWLFPYIDDESNWSDAKMLAFEDEPCPRAVLLGSSLSFRALFQRHLATMPVEPPIDSSFNFGLSANRVSVMLGQWKQVVARGCRPDYVFVETSAPLFNRRPGPIRHYLPVVLSVELLLDVPRLTLRRLGIRARTVADMLVWDRWLVGRRREAVLELASAGWSGKHHSKTPPVGGEYVSPVSQSLVGQRRQDELRFRHEQLKDRRFRYDTDPSNFAVLGELIDEIQAVGATVVLHTPPVTSLYRQALRDFAVPKRWCPKMEEIVATTGVRWWSDLDGRAYTDQHFFDWDHLNETGAALYAQRLGAALQSGQYRDDAFCREP